VLIQASARSSRSTAAARFMSRELDRACVPRLGGQAVEPVDELDERRPLTIALFIVHTSVQG
jgi:hypothetical protein